MKVLVGSRNPVKIKAVREVFGRVFSKEGLEVEGVAVESGVAEQPKSNEESLRGARNRARRVIEKGKGDYGIGLEGGVYEEKVDGERKMFSCAWCVVRDREGVEGYSGGLRFELPEKVAERIREGGELGPVMDEFLGREEVKKQEGMVGVLTKGLVTRKEAYKRLVEYGLVRFVSANWFEKR